VTHPAARQTAISEATKSRPARRHWNSAARWSSHNHTSTPPGSASRSRLPRPAPRQIAHGGRLPSRSPLSKLLATPPILSAPDAPVATDLRPKVTEPVPGEVASGTRAECRLALHRRAAGIVSPGTGIAPALSPAGGASALEHVEGPLWGFHPL
jgi:hypothetical protein